ncbi:MAG: heme-binding protein [Verrucomicrobiales bacterium]|nr:heme-binding protein [Verrucomicrobiales bacterium]
MKSPILFLVSFLGALVAWSDESVALKPTLTLEGARVVLTAAESYAREQRAPGAAVAVVDDGGHLLAFVRLDGTFVGSPNISIGKARTAALFRKPTGEFEDLINKGRFTMTALQDFTPLQGGVPILHEGRVIGAIGVSGASSALQDEEIAKAGARALPAVVAARK